MQECVASELTGFITSLSVAFYAVIFLFASMIFPMLTFRSTSFQCLLTQYIASPKAKFQYKLISVFVSRIHYFCQNSLSALVLFM